MQLIIHAPTVAALERARRNLANLLVSEPNAEVELVVNGAAAIEAVRHPNPEIAPYCVVCENTLRTANLEVPNELRTTEAAIVHIAHRQAEGWSYFRA